MWCRCRSSGVCQVPPAPDVMARLFADYLRRGKPHGLSFKAYLEVIGFVNVAEERPGMDDGRHARRALPTSPELTVAPQLISVPTRALRGTLRVKVLLVDFSDRPGTTPVSHYESMLFSKNTFVTGSMRDYYQEASHGKIDITGSVHGWLRLPHLYSHYTNGKSGLAQTYPRNAQGMAEDAVRTALTAGVNFEASLDALDSRAVTALFIVHAGLGAEAQTDENLRANNMWSHKWALRSPLAVGNGLHVSVYLTVPHDARIGVCAHELGHLAFQWEDFYDPNYDEDGSEWDGSGRWDLMAGGSWNGNGARPAHPAALHKLQHGWLDVQHVSTTTRVTLEPFTKTAGKAVRVSSPEYRSGQYLLLENRKQSGFDTDLPGQGLLVWRVDESNEMFKPDRPALLLLQADGRHDLERPSDWNEGDAGDPFPGSASRTELDDDGDLSTTFPGHNRSGVKLLNIARDPVTGVVSLDVEYPAEAPSADPGAVITRSVAPQLAIPDASPTGVSSELVFTEEGSVQELAVDVDVSHSYVGDLRVELVAPSGALATLSDRAGGNTDDLRRTFRSSELEALALLAGEQVAGSWRLRVLDLAARDTGVLNKWGLAIAASQATGPVKLRATPMLTIPDSAVTGVSDSLEVTRGGKVKAIAVNVDITHTYVGDLRVELVSPSGASALLHDRQGADADNLKRTFTSSDSAGLSALIGSECRGAWALRVSDLAARDIGVLKEWGLELALTSPAQSVEVKSNQVLPIPDNAPAGVGSALTAEAVGTVQSLELVAKFTHPYIGDLRVELVAPSGKSAVLHERTGGRTKDLELGLTSSTNPALASLVGQPLKGKWVLRVADLASADQGELTGWSLKLSYA